MISPEFYSDKTNIVSLFLGGKRRHFLPKEPDILLSGYEYTLAEGDTFPSLAHTIFGPGNSRLWTVLSDGNRLRMVDDWEKEMDVVLPYKVVFTSNKTQ